MRIATQQIDGLDVEPDRWHLLLDAVVTMAADLSLEDLLGVIIEAAADIARARHAVLVVGSGTRQRPLVAHGLTDEEVAQLTELPEGFGLLESPTGSYLGVPVGLGEKEPGTLFLTDKVDGTDFTAHDEQIVLALAAAAEVAIDNARLREDAQRRERWLAAAADLTTALLRPEADHNALQIVADRTRELAGADVAWVVVGPDPAHQVLQAVSGLPADPAVMDKLDFTRSLERCVAVSGRPLTVRCLAEHPRAVDVAGALGGPRAGPALVVPLRSAIGVEGVVGLAWWNDVDPADVSRDPTMPMLFAEQAALALHVARARRDQQRLAVLEDRDRIARDLHDLVIQRLFAIGLELQGTAGIGDAEEMSRRLDTTIEEIDVTIRDIRRTIFGLRAKPDAGDPRAVVVEVVERAARMMRFHPTLEFRGPVRLLGADDLLPDVLAVLTEALSNAVRHAHSAICAVEVSVGDGVTVRVSDDGRGMPDDVQESGLANVRLRAERRGGSLTVSSAKDRGTSLLWWVPSPDDVPG
ncbi:diguanylate cyclase [Nocardioides sp. dk4132]|uniref:GAF domain-containing sensor histidine kinase n=1 Tax=unclassified Nocardioides TaxID=2615069 RepID=UPI001294ECE2|nr:MULTISPECIES: GAF domain-containing sensor histidine kinase [unclassified Nocardioides]MQW77853.1 diguanylate cyclase [Nocardioides sp. dk4132]QGA08243.1 diguanylate cyclase [Nocardioides sp. dk884]